MKKTLISLVLVFTIILFAGCSKTDKEDLIISYDNSVNGYTVSLYQVGEPQGAFGSVNAKLVLKDADDNIIDETAFELANDGADVLITNITAVNWYDDRVEIGLKELDTSNELTYVLNYES